MVSIRTKLILIISVLVFVISTLSCLFFFSHVKKQQEYVLKKFGTSLVLLFTQDNEVKHALRLVQPAFLDAPIKMARDLDTEGEISYLRISDNHVVMVEEKSPWIDIDLQEIPLKKDDQRPSALLSHNVWTRGGPGVVVEEHSPISDTIHFRCITIDSGEVFCDFTAPIYEKQTFSEEEFAAQVFGEDGIAKEEAQPILGFVQIGLSHHKLNERIHKIIWQSIIPMGLFIVLGGICVTFFLTRYIVSPLRHMASITLDIAKGNFNRTIDIRSRDEIGQLSLNFNEMTKSLRTLYDEKEKIMAQLRENIHSLCHTNTELKKAQERLVRSEKLAAVGKLASGVGHELRNPLGAIRNALFVLKKKMANGGALNDTQKQNQFMEIIEKETERGIKIVNDLLGFSRTAKPSVSPTNIRSVIESSLSRFKTTEKIRKVVQVEDPLPLVHVDATQIEQVFINLIQNAYDAMPMGGLLTIRAQQQGSDLLAVTFADTGCGIPDTMKNLIFDPLFTTKPKGLGLGLAVSSSIVQRHGGILDVESKEGEGATFVVKLPVATPQGSEAAANSLQT